jgi:hypothetical protein
MKIKKKLKKYGKGDEIPEKKKIEDSFVDANNFLKTWQQSPMYNEMLNNSSSGNEYSKISNYRNKSLNLNPTNNLNVEKTLLNDPNTTGFVRKGTPVVNISSDWHNNNEMLSRLKTESDTLKERLGETPDYKIPTNFVTPSTIVHEMSHITDWKGLPKTDLQKIKNFSSDRDKNKFSNYVANPSETRSRLNEIRYENSLLKYYNPLTEKINKEQYNNYLKDKSKGNALKDLKNVYSDDEIIDMLNSISENKSSQEQIPMAKNGGSINKYPNGGKPPKYEWSKGIDNIQPITQTQNNSSITTGNKKLSTEELKKAAEYTKKYNQQHLEEEYNNRQNKLKQSIDAQKQPLSLKNLQTQTQSTGDKFSLAMNSKYGNPKDYPTLSGYMQGLDYINPAKMIGDMTSGLGSVPQDINEGNYLKAGLSVASPLFTGAVAGIGTQGLKPFVNNLVNPLAGTGEVINNLGNKYLPNAYKLNPSAFKPNSEAYYRIIGNEEGLDDLVNSGVLRSNPNNLNKKGSLMYKDPYFSKGVIFDKDYYKNNPYKGKYVAEVSDIEMHHNPPGSFSFDNNIAIPKEPIKINNTNLKLYEKDWLKGYKPIEIPKKQNGGNITTESEWELVNETNKKLPKRRLNLNKSSDWEIVD